MRRGVAGFSGERLIQVLEARSSSQLALATLVDVSSSTVSKWCRGDQAPEADTAKLVAEKLNVQLSWLLRPVPDTNGGPVLCRSNASALLSAREMMRARHEWAKEIAIELEKFVEFPKLDVPTVQYTEVLAISDQDIEKAALACRRQWKLGIGPLSDVVLALENAGAVVVREETGVARIEGLSSWCKASGRPIVYLSSDKENAFRSRFDAAHELGHLVLHKFIDEAQAKKNHKEMERQAHTFASAFLMPAEAFALELPAVPTLDTLLALKLRWKVSVAAMIKRVESLRVLGATGITNLWKLLSARGWRTREPYDDEVKAEQPRLLRRSIELLIDSNVMTTDHLPEVIGPSPGDIERLAGLPLGYFRPKQNNVVSLSAIRLRSSGGI